MNVRPLLFTLLALTPFATLRAADEGEEKKPHRNEALRAQMIEDAKKQSAKPASTSPAKPTTPATKDEKSATSTPAATPATPTAPATAAPANPIIANTAEKALANDPAAPATPAPATKPADEPATVLPKVEVNRGKLHPLARELYEKEKEISREKQLTKPTELDKALNDPKMTVPLFGGQSTASRASVASERTALLEAEADLIEEIGRAKTKEQKAELRKQLDELKKVRRELEHAIR